MLDVPNNSHEECDICLSNSTTTHFTTLICGHTYHLSCITRWIEWNNTHQYKCPRCQINITKEYCTNCNGNLFPFDRKIYACGHKYHTACAFAHSYIDCLGIHTNSIDTPVPIDTPVHHLLKQPEIIIITKPSNTILDQRNLDGIELIPLITTSKSCCLCNMFNYICRLPCTWCCKNPD